MYEIFYLLHDRFDPEARNWIAWKVNPVLVRSIERWCNSIHQLEPIDREFMTNRVEIQAHFDRWYLDSQTRHGLDRSTLVDLLTQHLLTQLRQHPQDRTIGRHWLAFLMQRCVTVGWQIWRIVPQQLRSVGLFEDIVAYGYSTITNPDRVLENFQPGTSQLVSGLNHLKAFVDRQIRYSIFPYLRQESGDPNFGRTNLGVAARHSRSEIIKALGCLYPPTRVEDEIILWQCFELYRQETGIHVHRLVAADFEQIGQFYQQRLDRSINFTGAEIRQRLEAIGSAVRNYKLRQPVSLDAPLTQDENNPTTISLGETNPIVNEDWLAAQVYQEILKKISMEITSLLDEPSPNQNRPSCQQLFWLYYGLPLKQQQIVTIINCNFGLNSNNGNVSLQLQRGRKALFQRIHAALENETPVLTNLEINAAMSTVMEMYFDTEIPNLLEYISPQFDLPAQKAEFVEAIATWMETKLNLNLQFDFVKAAIEKIVCDFLRSRLT